MPSVPRVLTHDQAIAQKENPGKKRRHHDQSRSEDETTLTIAENLPAEIPLLPCTSLPVKNAVLKFPSPSRRKRRKTMIQEDGAAQPGKSLEGNNAPISVPSSVRRDSERDVAITDLTVPAPVSPEAGTLFGAWLFKNSPEPISCEPNMISTVVHAGEEHVAIIAPSPNSELNSSPEPVVLEKGSTAKHTTSTEKHAEFPSPRFSRNNQDQSPSEGPEESVTAVEIFAEPPYSATVLRQSFFE